MYALLKRYLKAKVLPYMSRPGVGGANMTSATLEALPGVMAKAFSPNVVRASFASCSLALPFTEEHAERMRASYAGSVGGKRKGVPLGPVVEEAANIVSELLVARTPSPGSAAKKARVSPLVSHTASGMVKEQMAKKEQAAKEAADKVARKAARAEKRQLEVLQKLQNRCRAAGCGKIYRVNLRDRDQWTGCEVCPVFWACPAHGKCVLDHEKECDGKGIVGFVEAAASESDVEESEEGEESFNENGDDDEGWD